MAGACMRVHLLVLLASHHTHHCSRFRSSPNPAPIADMAEEQDHSLTISAPAGGGGASRSSGLKTFRPTADASSSSSSSAAAAKAAEVKDYKFASFGLFKGEFLRAGYFNEVCKLNPTTKAQAHKALIKVANDKKQFPCTSKMADTALPIMIKFVLDEDHASAMHANTIAVCKALQKVLESSPDDEDAAAAAEAEPPPPPWATKEYTETSAAADLAELKDKIKIVEDDIKSFVTSHKLELKKKKEEEESLYEHKQFLDKKILELAEIKGRRKSGGGSGGPAASAGKRPKKEPGSGPAKKANDLQDLITQLNEESGACVEAFKTLDVLRQKGSSLVLNKSCSIDDLYEELKPPQWRIVEQYTHLLMDFGLVDKEKEEEEYKGE